MVCSSTPTEALERKWAEHNIAKYTKAIAGQEMVKKANIWLLCAQNMIKTKL